MWTSDKRFGFSNMHKLTENFEHSIDAHADNLAATLKNVSALKQDVYKRDGKPIKGQKYITTDSDHQKIFDELINMGYKKTKGYDSSPNTWTKHKNHEEMFINTDSMHHPSGISAYIRQEHGGKTQVVFNDNKLKEEHMLENYSEMSDKDLEDVINYHKSQRNKHAGTNEIAYDHHSKIVKKARDEQQNRLNQIYKEDIDQLDEISDETKRKWLDKAVQKSHDDWRKDPSDEWIQKWTTSKGKVKPSYYKSDEFKAIDAKIKARRNTIQNVSKDVSGKKHFSDMKDNEPYNAAEWHKGKRYVTDFNEDCGCKIGEKIHLGFGAKGGTGFIGTVTKLDGDTVHIKNDKGKMYKGPLSYVSKLDESEQLDEISKETLGSYIRKSVDDIGNKSSKIAKDTEDTLNSKDWDEMKEKTSALKRAMHKVANRKIGVDRATRALTNESYKLSKDQIIIPHTNNEEEFAKEYVKAHKGNYKTDPSDADNKHNEKFYSKYDKKIKSTGFGGSGVEHFTNKQTGEKFSVTKTLNGKSFYGTDYHIKKLEESALLETSVEKDLQDHEPRIVHGFRGVKSKPFSKKFKSQDHMEKWLDSDDGQNCEIHTIQKDH